MRISDWSSDVCSSDLVADRIGELHLFAAREHRGGILDDLRVEAVGHLVAEARQREAALVLVGVDLGEDRVEIEIVEMFRTTADLTQQFGAADHLVEALDPEPGEDVADFLGDEDRKSTRLNSRHSCASRMPASA